MWFTSYYFSEMLTILTNCCNVTPMYLTGFHVDPDARIWHQGNPGLTSWRDQQSSPSGSRLLCKKNRYVTPRKITYNDAIYNDCKIFNVFYDYNHETVWCSALKPERITYKAKPYKTFSETIRALIWEDSKKIKLICSKNEYKTINGTESPSPWWGMEKLRPSYNHCFRNNQDYGWNVNKRKRSAPTNYLQHSNCVMPAARVHHKVLMQALTWSVCKCDSPGTYI